MGVTWTEDQKKVIELRNRNILVSAAAGSGKTAVLVERIMELVCDETHPVDIDHLLVVTFTKAAAAEMKERVGNAIRAKLEKQPENGYLQRQETLIHHAQITTIDSFCSYILRNHFGEIDLDPAFRVADEGELKLLKRDVLHELLEEEYAKKEEPFFTFIECYASGKNDAVIEELILKLFEFSTSHPFPEEWLKESLDACEKPETSFSHFPWYARMMEHIRLVLKDLQKNNETARALTQSPDGPLTYEEALLSDALLLQKLCACETYEELSGAIRDRSYQALSRKKMPVGTDERKKEEVKQLRDSMKKSLDGLAKQYFYASAGVLLEGMRTAFPAMSELIRLTLAFSEKFTEKKRKRSIVDFSDMEHLALNILVKQEHGVAVPSEVAKSYADYFAEIMVDEYQDSNLVQEYILNSISKKGAGKNNRFMVGDVKQSIYRFRQARPELFMEKYETYTAGDSDCQKICLSKNFRSRQEVVDSVNYIFERIMIASLGNVTYDADAALYLGADLPKPPQKNQFETALLLGELPGEELEEDFDKIEFEASMVAGKILELKEQSCVTDKKTGNLRAPDYGDFVILLRSMSGMADIFAKVLTSCGIPVVTGTTTGYFSAPEVRTILNYLSVLDNERQDIPFTAVLHSPIGKLDSEEMAVIRAAYPELLYYEACRSYAAGVESEAAPQSRIVEKLRTFYEMTDKLRQKSEYLSIHELLWEIYEVTAYDKIMLLQSGGEVRRANLQMLVQKALDFEATSYRGLFNFVRYIDNLQKYEVDFGEAQIGAGNEAAVHLMSIHKSKGLEFPIVFVSGLSKRFNKQDSREKTAMHPVLGIGVDAIDPKRRIKLPTLSKKVIQKQTELENLGEELRVLYVAMTRARDQLILTGTMKEARETVEQLSAEAKSRPEKSFLKLSGAACCLDWILECVSRENAPVSIEYQTMADLSFAQVELQSREQLKAERLEAAVLQSQKSASKQTGMGERFSYQYPYTAESALPGKVSVSELKKADWTQEDGEQLYEEQEIVPYVPAFLKGEREVSPTDRGTAYHKIMECMDFEGIHHLDQVKERLEALTKQGIITPELSAVIKPYDIYRFAQTELSKRMLTAREHSRLFKEQPFVIARPAREIYPETDSSQDILIQGIMDACFEEADGFVLVDYKTDRVQTEEALILLYRKQLELYAEALEQMSGKPVKECVIYSFALGREIRVD